MHTGKAIKAGLISIISLIIISIGVYSFLQLKSNKETQNADIYKFISDKSNSVMQINDLTFLDNYAAVFPLSSEVRNIFKTISGYGEETAISFYPQENIICSKITVKDYKHLINAGFSSLFAPFPPKQEHFKGMNLYIYSGMGNRFFCCTYYKGLFIGSFSKTLVQQAIEAFLSQKNLANDNTFSKFRKSINRKTPATLFLKEDNPYITEEIIPFNDWLTCDVDIKNKSLICSGNVHKENENNIYSTLTGSEQKILHFNSSIIPDNCSELLYTSLKLSDFNSIFADSIVKRSVHREIGIMLLKDEDTTNYYTPLIVFFKLKEKPDLLFNYYLQSNLKKDYTFLKKKQKVYLNKLFGENSDTYMFALIYNGYLILAPDKQSLEKYQEEINKTINPDLLSSSEILDSDNPKNFFFYKKEEMKFPFFQNEIKQSISYLILLNRNNNGLNYTIISKPS